MGIKKNIKEETEDERILRLIKLAKEKGKIVEVGKMKFVVLELDKDDNVVMDG